MRGRHTDPDRGAFWRSLGSAAGKALLVLVILAGITTLVVYLTVDADGGDDGAAVLADAAPTSPPPPAADATPGAVPDDEADREQPASDDRPDEGAAADDDEPGDESGGERAEDAAAEQQVEQAPAPTDEVTVQVIDSGASSAAVEEVLGLLEGWGYDVVAVNPGLCCYEATTLFYSDGRAADAEALQARDERFAVLEENRRLDEAVALHVVVGEDWHAP